MCRQDYGDGGLLALIYFISAKISYTGFWDFGITRGQVWPALAQYSVTYNTYSLQSDVDIQPRYVDK